MPGNRAPGQRRRSTAAGGETPLAVRDRALALYAEWRGLREAAEAAEAAYLRAALDATGWNAREAARLLGVAHTTLARALDRHPDVRAAAPDTFHPGRKNAPLSATADKNATPR